MPSIRLSYPALRFKAFPLSVTFAITLTVAVSSCSVSEADNDANTKALIKSELLKDETAESWNQAGQQELQRALAMRPNTDRAKNVIFFVGDGMGISTVTASRIFDGQSRGETGEENLLSFEQFPYLGLSKTYNANQQTPDSAGTMTAMITGAKTKAGFISVSQQAIRGNCESAKNAELPSLLEQAELAGLSTGVVTTARITHATPAATYAHVPERDWEDDNDMPAAEKAAGCKDIASQLIDFNKGNGIEVAMGGGRHSFLPNSAQTGNKGERQDGRDLTQEWVNKTPQSYYVADKTQLEALDLDKTQHLLGLFNASHMQYEEDRANGDSTEPSLTEMTRTAITLLKKNPKGFFLMVEAGRIDHAHHAGNAARALRDTQELSEAVKTALSMTDIKDTLIVVTADHSHTFTMAGYATRGNPILGKVVGNDSAGNPANDPALARDQQPYTTLGYRNGVGHDGAGRKDLSHTDTLNPDFRQEALVPMSSETHGGEDVAIYANGPWAHLFHNTHEQNYIYHVMRHAAGIE